MKTILRVIRTGDQKIRFETDLDVKKNPEAIPDLVNQFTLSMMTTLWGGNELSVLAVIRAMAIADLAVSVNRKEMIRHLDEASRMTARVIAEAKEAFKRSGGTVIDFPPGVGLSDVKS
jgi:hypothetical protein